ncbi:tetratricopeptide repeat protein [Paraburkholderia bryophila]|uniref:tetratricopeptide repeat protein n=1 Tax=Paraburkholderia bryophila TaxID=420952 RepID=UPI00234A390D|nr:tetratricopeptide repeat protein [Paraburkholderia bryophila]WCM22136.1 tetratricopeptide repeat protein [Paraburkholderia bryophila]
MNMSPSPTNDADSPTIGFLTACADADLALRAAPARAELWEHAGLIAAMQGDHGRAEACYQRALSLSGSTASLHRNLADCLQQRGRLAAAKAQYKLAIELEPDLHQAFRCLARISTQLGEADEAADYWLRAWTIASSSLQDGLDLVVALAKANRTADFGNVVSLIVTRYPDNVEALEKLTSTLIGLDRFSEALSVARKGLAVDPRRPPLHHFAAFALSMLGKMTECLPHCVEAAQRMPDIPMLQFHLAQVQLGSGEFADGWTRFKAFYSLPDISLTVADFPQWNGECVSGRQFLIVGEQGRGDEIQCLRFAVWLCRRGATVDVMVSEPVARIAAGMPAIRSVFTVMPVGPYDFWSHMFRMPEHIGLDLSMLPIAMPYIATEPEKRNFWRDHINAISPVPNHAKRRRIGVVWAGGPASTLDRFRSICVAALKPLFALPGASWFSVQKGERERESESLAAEFDIHTLGPRIHDFADTLAILETLDLLITVDTSVAHLAGAANLPVWVLLPAYLEWRWLHGRNDSPWYPSMRLFRQRELGNWAPVIEEVRMALLDHLNSARNDT